MVGVWEGEELRELADLFMTPLTPLLGVSVLDEHVCGALWDVEEGEGCVEDAVAEPPPSSGMWTPLGSAYNILPVFPFYLLDIGTLK
jgi:hypothetical protein